MCNMTYEEKAKQIDNLKEDLAEMYGMTIEEVTRNMHSACDMTGVLKKYGIDVSESVLNSYARSMNTEGFTVDKETNSIKVFELREVDGDTCVFDCLYALKDPTAVAMATRLLLTDYRKRDSTISFVHCFDDYVEIEVGENSVTMRVCCEDVSMLQEIIGGISSTDICNWYVEVLNEVCVESAICIETVMMMALLFGNSIHVIRLGMNGEVIAW